MKIGITGATGQLGRLVLEKLKEHVPPQDIIALVRSPKKVSNLDIETREFDYNKSDNLTKSLIGVDKLLLISSNEIGQRFKQHVNVIDAAKQANVKLIVYTSLLHADTSSLNLAGEHLATEKVLKESNIPFIILRNGWYSENYTNSISGSLAGGAFLGSAGEGKISSAARADYAEAAVAVLTSKGQQGKTFELAGDESYTLSDLAKEISRQTGKNIPYKNLTEVEYSDILIKIGVPEGFARAIASWDIGASKGDLFDDGYELPKLIGRPTTSIIHSVKDALAIL